MRKELKELIKETSSQIFLTNQLINNRVNTSKNMRKMEELRTERDKLQNKLWYGI